MNSDTGALRRRRVRAWAAAALAVAVPLIFATPADAAVTGSPSPNYAGTATSGAAAQPGLGHATSRPPVLGAGVESATAPDSALAAVQEQVIARAGDALGFHFDRASGEFVVVYPDGEAASPARFGTVADEVRIEESSLSAATVAAFAGAIEDRGFHPDAADYSYGTYVDVVRDVIVLGTDAPASVVAPLVAGLGDAVQVRFGESNRARLSDPPPHWGGASITSGGFTCTSGFTGITGGVRVMVTAGHCFNAGAAVVSTGTPFAWGNFFPHVNLPDPDLAIIANSTYQGAIYLGPPGPATAAAAVSSFADPVMGFNNYCFSGQTSGERCGNTVVSFAGTLCDPLGCTFNLTVSNGPLVQPGDSGSPWFVYTSGNVPPVHIRGITIGVVAGQNYWHRYSQVAVTGVTGVPFP